MVDIGTHGRRSDGGIFKTSSFGNLFEKESMNLPKSSPLVENGKNIPYCMVGDEAFPLKRYLLRPFPKKTLTVQKNIFNYRLGRARRVIERAFGILVAKWRIFRRPITLNISNATKVVQATICLHNWLRMKDFNEDERFKYETSSVNTTLTELTNTAFYDINLINFEVSQNGINIRNEFLKYFNNEGGAVFWQKDCI